MRAFVAAVLLLCVSPLTAETLSLDLGSSTTLALVRIRSGSFTMGSPWTEVGRGKDEGPQTQVTFTRDFWLGETEVTQAQYRAVMNSNPSVFKGDDFPVGNVSRLDAEAFCAKASEITGRHVRLPSEARWEYACRAGTTTAYFTGDEVEELDAYAWFDGNSRGELHPVRMKKPNPWGLYDITGNAMEWCGNDYGPYSGEETTDPRTPNKGPMGVLRPGVFYVDEFLCRSAARSFWPPTAKDKFYGFRVLVEAE